MTYTEGMSEVETAHAPADEDHAHPTGDAGAHGGEPLGPVDVAAWVYAIGGAVAGLIVVLALAVARGG